MLRSVRYGFSGAVLAGVVGGMVAWGHVDKTVSLVVDGHTTTVHTTAARVGDVLAKAGYRLGTHDLLAPTASAAVHNGTEIVFRRGRLLHLDVDGHDTSVWTTAPTVADALGQLGYSTADFTSVSRSRRLPLTPTDIAVRTPKSVTVRHDGKTQTVTTTDSTVGQMLADLDITVGPHDRLSEPQSHAIAEGARIVLTRVTTKNVTSTMSVPYSIKRQNDSSLEKGVTKVVKAGKNGSALVTYAMVYVDGKVVGKTKVKTVTLASPTAKVEKVGTKAAAPATPNAPLPSPGSAKDIARQLLLARGWGDDQYSCLTALWGKESAWRVNAGNQSSGAYGIPQALPGSKMASAGPNWRTDATTQITWGLGYISSRYGTPCGAWSAWNAHGGWY
ncbi:ubiquitin-like domain-containing protein [Jatrophihabitans sp.]|uniref:aggregation-promoting factor C-terminal-like domain-containing protein n=1 Tax=Jatrophihabitans sp. TaxID=1932789 RepID=UPI0030C7833B|nr:hypothetical protein [Jatrophihabitans sp.]